MSPLRIPLLSFSVPGPWELAIILFIVLLLFGAKRLPEIARGLGESIKEFKKSASDIEKGFKEKKEKEKE